MKIKIELDKNQSREEAEEILYKALNSQRTGAQHSEEFQDPVMNELYHQSVDFYGDLYEDMIAEIIKVLED